MLQNPPFKLVKVTWKDIASMDGSWRDPKDLALEAWKLWDKEHYSVGVISYETLDFIVLSATWDGEDFSDSSMIPRSVITKIELITSPEGEWVY